MDLHVAAVVVHYCPSTCASSLLSFYLSNFAGNGLHDFRSKYSAFASYSVRISLPFWHLRHGNESSLLVYQLATAQRNYQIRANEIVPKATAPRATVVRLVVRAKWDPATGILGAHVRPIKSRKFHDVSSKQAGTRVRLDKHCFPPPRQWSVLRTQTLSQRKTCRGIGGIHLYLHAPCTFHDVAVGT